MGSRLRVNPSKIIECWCEIVGPQGTENPPWIIQKFPRSYEEVDTLKSIPQFTFPCSFEKLSVQHFSFVMTNLESKFLYGFCRHAPDSETAIVILSHLPWHELFYKLLNHCSTLVSNKNSDLWSFLQCLYQTPVPSPGTKLTITYGDNQCFTAECPNHLNLPSIPENRNLSEYFSAIDIENMMIVFASMLNERRIIVTSERVSRLSACVQAANSLIYPMSWQHIFIPVLPEHLIDYLNAPMPFLIGVSLSMMQNVRQDELGDVVMLNADTNQVLSPYNDLASLPEEVTSSLRKNLNASNGLLGDGVARAFLKALVQLIGNYREALQFRDQDRKISFNEEKFVSQRPNHFQSFCEKMLELQIFRQFIEERLDLLNSGLHTSDEFELEASVFGEKSSSKMKQILSNVKKESGAIMKNVKNKTNPAMKSAVKSVAKGGKNVREKSKITYKGIRGKLKDIQQNPQKQLEDGGSFPKYMNGDSKPRSAPSSPTQPSGRRSSNKYASEIFDDRGLKTKVSSQQSANQSPFHSDNRNNLARSSEDLQKTPSPQEIDLIGEMEDVFKSFSESSPRIRTSTSSLSSCQQQETNSTISMSSSIVSSNLESISNPFGDSVPFGEQYLQSANGDLFASKLGGYTNSKVQSTQDLLLMESPGEEEFDPLFTKDIPPPIPARHIKSQDPVPALPSRRSMTDPPAVDRRSVPVPPRRLSPTRYLPFGNLQQTAAPTAHNPLYNKAQLGTQRSSSSTTVGPFLHGRPMMPPRNTAGITKSMISLSGYRPNSAASFAATMLATNKSSPTNFSSAQEKSLLGDFSTEFRNLSTKDRNSNS